MQLDEQTRSFVIQTTCDLECDNDTQYALLVEGQEEPLFVCEKHNTPVK